MKRLKRGDPPVFLFESDAGWYILVGAMAVCSHHGPPHIHRNANRKHPDHWPKVPVRPGLARSEAFARVVALCRDLGRLPELDELQAALA